MKPILLCLHGWGGSQASFVELRAALVGTDVEILTPDLPGFGTEPDPPEPWSVDEYADWVVRWLADRGFTAEMLAHRRFLLLGHSHGGRIAIKLTAGRMLPVHHLYLCGAAGIRRPRHFKRIVGLTLAKTGRFLLSVPGLRALQPLGKKLLYQFVRVHDYEQASPVMRQTLIRVSAEDLRPFLPRIQVPTDLFWGTDDRMTPLRDGKLMHTLIEGSRFHTFRGVRHGVHRERAGEIAQVIRRSLLR